MSFEFVKDERLEEPMWFGGPNSYLAVWGEYVRTNSWAYKRKVCCTFGQRHASRINNTEVNAKLHIGGKCSKGRYRPTHWSLVLLLGQHRSSQFFSEERQQAMRGKCKSVQQAIRAADEILENDALVNEFIAHAYKPNFQTVCLYRLKAEELTFVPSKYGGMYNLVPSSEDLQKPASWEPWATDLRTDYQEWWLPDGHYLAVSRRGKEGEIEGSVIHRTMCSSCSGGNPEATIAAKELGMWC